MAKGYNQTNVSDTFAPVGNFGSLRLLLAISASKGWDARHLDVKTAFLHGEIDQDDLYVKQPLGFVVKGKEDHVLRLLKSLYGLQQANKIWNKTIHDILTKGLGFTRSKRDPCIYFKINSNEITIISLYVDDLFTISNNPKRDYAKELEAQGLDIQDLGPLKYFLGIRAARRLETGEISLDQEKYVDMILAKFGMTDCSSRSTPINECEPLSESMCPTTYTEHLEMRNIPYREAIGSIMYLAVSTRPDISKAVSNVSKYLQNPGPAHWMAVKRILRYLKGTRDLKLILGKRGAALKMKAYSDADLAGDLDKRRSTTGYVILLDDSPIMWKSRLQATTAKSTTEAEYMAVSDTSAEVLYFIPLLKEMGIPPTESIRLMEDNQGCISVAKNPINNSRTKHIDIKHHFVRDLVVNGTIALEYCDTKSQLADILTKGLPKSVHWKFLKLLNMRRTL